MNSTRPSGAGEDMDMDDFNIDDMIDMEIDIHQNDQEDALLE